MPRLSQTQRRKKTSSRKAASHFEPLRRADCANIAPIVLGVDGGDEEFPDYVAIARRYAEFCVDGRLDVCKFIKLAAKRYLRMLDIAEDEKNPFYFSPAHVVDYCSFIEKLKHVEDGNWRFTQADGDGKVNPHIVLEPWQIWAESAIHGFRYRGTHERVVSRALEVIPRKNAKSLRVAGAALFELCCSGQLSPQITIGASTAAQANRVFSPIGKFVAGDSDLKEQFAIKVTQDEIRTPACGEGDGIIKLSSIGERQDGLNPLLAIFEEGHAGAQSVYNVIRSAMGARPNALLRMITTAGYRPEGPAYELIQEAGQILVNGQEDYSFFAAIYTLDEEDYLDGNKSFRMEALLSDEALMAKANPMWGVSISPAKIMEQAREARRRPDKRGEFLRTRYNIWTSSGTSLIEPHAWAGCRRKISLEDFQGQKCWIGVDLAQVMDMCAIGLVFELPNDVLAVFARHFLPEQSPTAMDPDLYGSIRAWRDSGCLTLTDGMLADHDLVRDEVLAYMELFDVQVIACDPLQAHNTVKHLWDGDCPVMVYPNSAKTMTAPTDDLLGRIAAQTVWHDGNPVLSWNAANVYGERRGNGSILPRKESDNSKRKIDGWVAVTFANGVRMQPGEAKDPNSDKPKPEDPYLKRGILGFEALDA